LERIAKGLALHFYSREIREMLGTKLLIVDDEEAFVETIAKRLSHREITVSSAYHGKDGLKRLEEDPEIDVVLLDVRMPEMDGIETLKRIKAACPTTEVIMLTGHASFDSAIEGMKLGAFDYLMKPVAIDDLIAKVEAAKNKRRQHQAKIFEAVGKELRGRLAR
jgi:DNA-binding NtrC family response regulator